MKVKLDGVSCVAGFFNSQHAPGFRRTTAVRRAEAYEIECVDSDGGQLYINDQPYEIRRGMVLCLRPGDVCRLPLPYRAYYLRLTDEVGDLTGRMNDWDHVFPVRRAQGMAECIRRIAEAQSKSDDVLVAALVLGLVSELDHEYGRASRIDLGARKKMRDSIRAGIEYIESHYREKCTLNQIAEHAGRSPIYFHDVFGEVMGMTPYEYIAKLRLDEAKRRLALTDEDPADIAAYCGFCSQSYFNYVFKKAEGITPLNFRRRAAAYYWGEAADELPKK
jgi:two-component system response regulator YesN